LSFRFGIILAAVLLTASCGFRPLYAPSGSDTAKAQVFAFDAFRKMEIAQIKDRDGQFLRNELVELMHPSGRARVVEYDLGIILSESKSGLAVRRSSDATRANLTIVANYVLKSRVSGADNKVVFSGSVKTTSGYNIFTSEFQTLSAEKSERERALKDVAQQLRLRLATEFASGNTQSRPKKKRP
jgi:LPS-assembly lipoprotein